MGSVFERPYLKKLSKKDLLVGQGSCSLSFCDLHLQKEPHFAMVLWGIAVLCTPLLSSFQISFPSSNPRQHGSRNRPSQTSLHLGCNHLVEFYRPGVRGTAVRKLDHANVTGADGRRLLRNNTNCRACVTETKVLLSSLHCSLMAAVSS